MRSQPVPCDLCGERSPDPVTICRGCIRDLGLDRFDQDDARRATPMRSPFLTVAEAARLLNTSPRTVRGLITAKRLVAVDLAGSASPNGHRYRIPRKALRRLVARDTAGD
ncbi:MAG: helix-turn-helix domain-containing protein [Chloroflexota bacterium]